MMFCLHGPNIVLMYPCFKIGCTFFKKVSAFLLSVAYYVLACIVVVHVVVQAGVAFLL